MTVATFNNPEPAVPLQDRLERAGLHAEIHDDRNVQKFWFLSRGFAGVRLKVPNKEFETANTLLAQWDTSDRALDEAVKCPKCKSSRVEFPQMTRFFVLPTLLAHLGLLFGLYKREFYCRACQNTWSLQEDASRSGRKSPRPPDK